MHFVVDELSYPQLDVSFIGNYKPYPHQSNTLQAVRAALAAQQTHCIINASVTGSGKTLANFAAVLLDDTGKQARTIAVYPTNELVYDQARALVEDMKVPAKDIVIMDSEGQDYLQSNNPQRRSHAQVWDWVSGQVLPRIILTNPDVLYLVLNSLYGQMFSTFHAPAGVRTFRQVLSEYPIIVFDEFHLYNIKQATNAAFCVGLAQAAAPDKPHVFIFSSATPQAQIEIDLKRLGLEPQPVTSQPARETDPLPRVVCETMEVDILPANLNKWEGKEAISNILPDILSWADATQPKARGVFILDSVYEAKLLARELRAMDYSDVGEVHGYMANTDRSHQLECRLSVGTSTIDVGVDLTGRRSKDFLVCEGRSAAQSIQRIGRLGRHGRNATTISISGVPNRVWLFAPEYVYNYLKSRIAEDESLKREDFLKLLNCAYLENEDFAAYRRLYAPLEAVATCERVLRHNMSDTRPAEQIRLYHLIAAMFGEHAPTDIVTNGEEAVYEHFHAEQQKKWRWYGTEVDEWGNYVKRKDGKDKRNRNFISDLESFRGGLESDLTVALYDMLDAKAGFIPVRTYNLPFILRRTIWRETSKEHFEAYVREHHPQEAEEWLKPLAKQRNLLGYVFVTDLVEGKANEMRVKLDEELATRARWRVKRLRGLTIVCSSGWATAINKELEKKSLNCWTSMASSYGLTGRSGRSLPPLFAVYPLDVGAERTWSIAIGLNAFMMVSAGRKPSKTKQSRGGAIFTHRKEQP